MTHVPNYVYYTPKNWGRDEDFNLSYGQETYVHSKLLQNEMERCEALGKRIKELEALLPKPYKVEDNEFDIFEGQGFITVGEEDYVPMDQYLDVITHLAKLNGEYRFDNDMDLVPKDGTWVVFQREDGVDARRLQWREDLEKGGVSGFKNGSMGTHTWVPVDKAIGWKKADDFYRCAT